METTRLYRPFEIRALSDAGSIAGYGSVFGVQDHYDDVVARGAFSVSLTKRMPLMLWQHDTDQPIGVWTTAKEDEKGLYLEGQMVMETQKAREAHALIKAKALDGLSIGFRTVRYEYDEKTDIRTLLEVELWEVSPVSFPANEAARIEAVKSRTTIPDLRTLESALRDAGLTRTEAKAVLADGFAALRDAAPPAPRDVGRTGNELQDLLTMARAAVVRARG